MTASPPPNLSVDDALQQAVAHHRAGRLVEAQQLYRTILQSYPQHPDANHNLGVLARQTGQDAAGLPYLKAALVANPALEQYWLSYAEALLAAGQREESRTILRQAVQRGLDTPALRALSERAETPDEISRIAALFNAGRHAELEAWARAEIERNPESGFAWKVLGVSLQAQGKDPVAALQNAANLLPDDPEAHGNLGTALKQLGRFDEAAASFQRAVDLRPEDAGWFNNLGIVLQELGQSERALTCLQRAVEIRADFGAAHNNLGNALLSLGRLDEAAASYRRALEIKPDFTEVHNNLGIVLHDLGQLDSAIASYRRATQLNPGYAQAYNNLGIALQETGQLEEGVENFRRATQIKPEFAEAHSNLGNTLRDLGEIDQALNCYRRAAELQPGFAEMHSNLGIALNDLGQLPEAIAAFRRALALNPGLAEARFNLGLCLLKTGQYAKGWPAYESRWEGGKPKLPRPVTVLPQWSGQQPGANDRLLVLEEQGLGDRLQFARYLALAVERFPGGVSLVIGGPLRALFRRSFPAVEILATLPENQDAWQWQCPLLSLPLAFGTTLENLPARVPYLVPDPAQVARWGGRIAALGLPPATRKIGLVWKTGRTMKNAALRSLRLQQLAPLLHLPGCAWFSLQKEPDPEKTAWIAAGKLIDWPDEFGDFDDTAGLAGNLDLIISVDTAVVHLAGGLGLPVWLLNRHASEWRWMRGREDNPWYPTLRIFNQATSGEWDAVVQQVRGALAAIQPWRSPGTVLPV